MIDFLENSIEEANIIFPEIKEFYQSYLEHGGKKNNYKHKIMAK